MATNSLEASGTLLWIRVSGLWASNHRDVGRNRRLVFRLSCRDSPKELWRSISLNCAIRNKQWTTGEGRVSFFTVSLITSSYLVKYWVSVQKWTLCTIPRMGESGTCPYKIVVSTFVVNGNYGCWGIGTVPLVTTAPRPRKFLGMGFSTDPTPCFSRA